MDCSVVVRFGPFAFDRARMVLQRAGQPISIGGRGAALLKALVDRLTALAGTGATTGLAAGALAFGGLLGFRIVGQAWVNAMTWRVRLGVEYRLRSRVAAKLSTLSAHTQATIGTGGLLARLSLSERLRSFAAGVIDTADVGFLVALALAALGLAVASVELRRER